MLYRSWAHLLSDPFLTSPALLCVSGELTIADRLPRLPGHLGSSWAQPMRSTRGRERPTCFCLLPLGDISDSSCSEALPVPERLAVVPAAMSYPNPWDLVTPSPPIVPPV